MKIINWNLHVNQIYFMRFYGTFIFCFRYFGVMFSSCRLLIAAYWAMRKVPHRCSSHATSPTDSESSCYTNFAYTISRQKKYQLQISTGAHLQCVHIFFFTIIFRGLPKTFPKLSGDHAKKTWHPEAADRQPVSLKWPMFFKEKQYLSFFMQLIKTKKFHDAEFATW